VENQIKARQMQNARTWSHESGSEDETIRRGSPLTPKSPSAVNIAVTKNIETGRSPVSDIDGDIVADGFFFHDTPKKAVSQFPPQHSPRYSPPPKRDPLDKWSALGDRRRAYTGTSESEKSPEPWHTRRNVGLGFTGFGAGVWDNKLTTIKDKGKECPWGRPRARDQHQLPHQVQLPTPRKEGKDKLQQQRADHGSASDLEWVGGWSDLHL